MNLESAETPRIAEDVMKKLQRRKVIMEEMTTLENTGTREVVGKPKDKHPVGCKWVFNSSAKQMND